MDIDDWIHLLLALISVLIVLLAGTVLTLSGQFTNQRLLPDALQTSDDKRHRSVVAYLNARRSLASAMRLIEMVFTIFAAYQIVAIVDRWTTSDFNWLSILLLLLVYIIFGRAIPRAIASRELSASLFTRLFVLGRLGATLVSPLTWLEDQFARAAEAVLPGRKLEEQPLGTEDELKLRMIEADDGVIGELERQMIDGILSLEEMTAREVMVPRLDIVALDRTASAREVIDTIIRAGHSRVPVYQDTLDQVIGVLYVKDLLPFVIGDTNRIPLLDLIRPAFIIPESKKLTELFAELKRTRIHMAVVSDEYGGTAGLITIEDILEEIVGEIQDEYDTEEDLITMAGDNAIITDGRLAMEDLERALGVVFEEDDEFSTLGGFVHKHLGRLAVRGDEFEAEGVRVEILSVERHRVRKMRVTRVDPPEPEPEPEESESWLQRLRGDIEERNAERDKDKEAALEPTAADDTDER